MRNGTNNTTSPISSPVMRIVTKLRLPVNVLPGTWLKIMATTFSQQNDFFFHWNHKYILLSLWQKSTRLLPNIFSEAPRVRGARASGAPLSPIIKKIWLSVHPKNVGSHVTVRPSDRPSRPQGNHCEILHFLASVRACNLIWSHPLTSYQFFKWSQA